MTWWCTGVRWRAGGGPVLGWYAPGRGERESPLVFGGAVAFRVRGGRRCLGVRRGGRWTECPAGAAVPGRVTRAQCEECARVDRAHSVAADTFADDPRPYHVYVAWFGPGLVKVGITGVARGGARLLEQGAVAYTWLGRGPLMAARRTEELLRTALGVPDRIPYARKRALRARLPDAAERAAELAGLHRKAAALGGRPESLEWLAPEVVDHGEVFGLAALGRFDGSAGPGRVVGELTDGGLVAGTLVAAAGPDLHLAVGGPGSERGLVIDSRLMSGWRLEGASDGESRPEVTVPVREIPVVQGGLF
ncbi:DUF2797 domain-containing protein [Streptomyces aurantiacus]|uniref:DUF2797 domain-containing protein n=1 Tax=Streptomyces aurantiacus JA 4570 TaxID=1286094 RepID=S3ZJP0_9ACTN|nr:DUF2797 domain-containing protein [Streptomyces aurantiacus]EPH43796.1 hypothetical protein STRAU_3114 [Streptomyces aurantiacus JA 4570]